MAGITQKSFETLFPLWSLKKTVVGYIDLEQKETYEKLKMEVDIVSDTGILIMLLIVMIIKMILLCWYCYCYCQPLMKVVIVIVIILTMY